MPHFEQNGSPISNKTQFPFSAKNIDTGDRRLSKLTKGHLVIPRQPVHLLSAKKNCGGLVLRLQIFNSFFRAAYYRSLENLQVLKKRCSLIDFFGVKQMHRLIPYTIWNPEFTAYFHLALAVSSQVRRRRVDTFAPRSPRHDHRKDQKRLCEVQDGITCSRNQHMARPKCQHTRVPKPQQKF